MENPVVHFEINGTEGPALERFYSEVFGWNVQSLPGFGYATIDTQSGGGINGGIGTAREGPPLVTFYVETPDPEASLAKAESLGATTVMPVTDIAVATYGRFRDPQGNVMGVVAPGEGPGVSPGDGAPVDWFEILGPDASALKAFYSELFGWDLSGGDSGDWEYYQLDSGTERGIGGGIGGRGTGSPTSPRTRWSTTSRPTSTGLRPSAVRPPCLPRWRRGLPLPNSATLRGSCSACGSRPRSAPSEVLGQKVHEEREQHPRAEHDCNKVRGGQTRHHRAHEVPPCRRNRTLRTAKALATRATRERDNGQAA